MSEVNWQKDDTGRMISSRLRDIADVALYEGSKPGTRAYIPVFTVAVGGLGCIHDHPGLLAVFTLGWMLAGMARWWVPRQALKHRSEDPDLWRERFRRSILLTPLSWGLFTTAIAYHYGIGWRILLCMFVAGGISTGATAAFNLDHRLHRSYVFLTWMPLLTGLAVHLGRDPGVVPLLLSSVVYTLYLDRLGQAQGKLYWRGLRDRLIVSQLAEFTASLVSLVSREQVSERLREALVPLIHFDRAWTGAEKERSLGEETLSMILGSTESGQLELTLSRKDPFTARDRRILEAFASPAGSALDRSHLFREVQRMARYDSLTRVANRAHFFESAREVLGVSRRLDGKTGVPTQHSVILMDIDHFKSVNDRHGHDVGDDVLRGVAARCQRSLREVDVFARYGGEEFVVFLPGANLVEAAEKTAERLRGAVSSEEFTTRKDPVRVTMSLGVAQIGEGESLEEALTRADAALYAAKRAGRDRVCSADPA